MSLNRPAESGTKTPLRVSVKITACKRLTSMPVRAETASGWVAPPRMAESTCSSSPIDAGGPRNRSEGGAEIRAGRARSGAPTLCHSPTANPLPLGRQGDGVKALGFEKRKHVPH